MAEIEKTIMKKLEEVLSENPHKEIKKGLSLLKDMLEQNTPPETIFLTSMGVEKEINYSLEKGYIEISDAQKYLNELYSIGINKL